VALIVMIAAGTAMTDLTLKRIVESALGDGRTIAGPLIGLRLTYNTGVAFSLGGALPTWFVAVLTGAIIAVGTTYLFRRSGRLNVVTAIGGGLLLGGALGNFIDRTTGGGVVDYFHTGWFATFNMADVYVTSGTVVLVVGLLWGSLWHPEIVRSRRDSGPSVRPSVDSSVAEESDPPVG
jgi:signal peptidase II